MIRLRLALAAAMMLAASPSAAQVAGSVGSPTVSSKQPGSAATGSQGDAAGTVRAEDVASVDAIIAALYEVISGPAGVKRDWDRFRGLFAPNARLIPTGRRPDGSQVMRTLTPEEYSTQVGPRLENTGFFEREIGRRTDSFGAITHVFSAYDSKFTLQDSVPFTRGINSIQLLNDGKRYWVVTVFWDSERPDNRIAEQYLRKQ